MKSDSKSKTKSADSKVEARRAFMKAAGKYAIATPPAMTILLASAKGNYAAAQSGNNGGGKSKGNNGFGNGGGDGVPGKSGKSDKNR